MGVSVTAETSVVKEKVGTVMQISNIFNLFAYCSNLTVIYAYGQHGRDQLCLVLLSIAQNGPGARITCMPYVGVTVGQKTGDIWDMSGHSPLRLSSFPWSGKPLSS